MKVKFFDPLMADEKKLFCIWDDIIEKKKKINR